MAYDKVVDSAALDAGIRQVADAIRQKGGTSESLRFPGAMAEAIAAIQAGGGFESSHAEIACGSVIPAGDLPYIPVDCGFPISQTDSFIVFFGGMPIAERTTSCNLAGYMVANMPSGGLTKDCYGGVVYANSTTTYPSTTTSLSLSNYFIETTGTDLRIRGYGAWNFAASLEYFWVVVKEKSV